MVQKEAQLKVRNWPEQRANEAISGLAKLSSPIFLNLPDGELGDEFGT
jgi:hypothetical protein